MRAEEILTESIESIENIWDGLGIQHSMFEKGDTIFLNRIVVPKLERNAGIGTKAMQALISYADQTNKRIALTPSSDFGGSKSRLENFYKGFGFVPNHGRYKDFTVRETMIRNPK